MKRLKVLIVEDSAVVRELLTALIEADPRLRMVGAVETGEEAVAAVHRLAPDVITMDVRLPKMNGFEATRQIMRERPTPIVVISASVEQEDLNITMNALRAGALTVIEKPMGGTPEAFAAIGKHICDQIMIMSEVKLVRQRGRRSQVPVSVRVKRSEKTAAERRAYRLLGITASTGGPNAVVKLLNGLGKEFPLPIALVQHIAGSFLEAYTQWLGSVTPFTTVVVRDRLRPEPGCIYVSPADYHLRIDDEMLAISREPAVHSQRPSGTMLFRTMAEQLGSSAIGVLLTGMGEDGAEGLAALRESGGYTIAEDESTAIVYGMPRAAVEIGAVRDLLPLTDIAPRLLDLVMTDEVMSS